MTVTCTVASIVFWVYNIIIYHQTAYLTFMFFIRDNVNMLFDNYSIVKLIINFISIVVLITLCIFDIKYYNIKHTLKK